MKNQLDQSTKEQHHATSRAVANSQKTEVISKGTGQQDSIQRKRQALVDHSLQVARLKVYQRIANGDHQEAPSSSSTTFQRRENNTGMPDQLKSGIENLSGYAMDDVKVHYNSSRPAQLNAHAFAQGNHIHIGPGQEQHLPHEAWHVVQQKQGRVKPTLQMKEGAQVNDDRGLEAEADAMGTKSGQYQKNEPLNELQNKEVSGRVIQGVMMRIEGNASDTDMIDNGDGTYTNAQTGNTYVRTSGDSNVVTLAGGSPAVGAAEAAAAAAPPPTAAGAAAAPPAVAGAAVTPAQALAAWTQESQGVRVSTPWGTVSAKHNRGAPYIQSRAKEYNRQALKTDYDSFIEALRSEGKADGQIAQVLLDEDGTGLTKAKAQRGAAMIHASVHLAEEWRKKGAIKIYRSILRRIISGEATLDDLLRDFRFIKSADDGRRQVARLHEAQYGYGQGEAGLSEPDQAIFRTMSPLQAGDLSSDDEERGRKARAVKKNRVFTRVVKAQAVAAAATAGVSETEAEAQTGAFEVPSDHEPDLEGQLPQHAAAAAAPVAGAGGRPDIEAEDRVLPTVFRVNEAKLDDDESDDDLAFHEMAAGAEGSFAAQDPCSGFQPGGCTCCNCCSRRRNNSGYKKRA